MQPQNPATLVTLQGTGFATKGTLAKGLVPNAGGLQMRPLVAAYWQANQPQGQVSANGYTKGTPAYFAHCAWYMACVGGNVVSNQGRVYTNANGLAGTKANVPGRATAHGLWVLAQVVAALQGPKAATLLAQATNAASVLQPATVA
jgi:chloramphenicol 3-O-phosphotransferase